MDEARVVQLIRRGEINAFDQIVATYEIPLVRYLARLTGNTEIARDLTQKTFLQAYKGILKTRAELSLKAWLYRIATNNALQHKRRRLLLNIIPFSRLGITTARKLTAPAAATEEQLDIQDALRTVPFDQRKCMVLHFVEGFRYREIAEIVGISEEAVRKRVARGSKRFRNEYLLGSEGAGN
ncbi:MAG: RNA polymerase sigma factor [Dehalococcoidia bacterium]